ncbi:MAG: phage portal protein [Gemmobacter sp.]
MIRGLFRRLIGSPPETRSSGAGYTAAVMGAREAWITGASGLAELTGTAQACISLWESAFATADVTGTDLIDRATMARIGRSLALRGEAVFLIRDRLIPAADWDLRTRDGVPTAYRLSVPEAGGGRTETALAAEVLHFRIGSDAAAPWTGTAPLRRARLSAELLHHLETALRDVFADAPVGSQMVHLPEAGADEMAAMRAAFRGRRGSVLVVEGAATAVAAGMHPLVSRAPDHLTPDLHRLDAPELLAAARGSVALAFGVLPALANAATTGPLVREAQRHLAQWTLEPLAKLVAEEVATKIGAPVQIDMTRPLQAFDFGGKSRAVATIVAALAEAKAAGIDPAAVLRLADLTAEGAATAE